MAARDLELFLQERLRAFDDTADLSPGSPADVQVIQPVLRRLGVDPFSVDLPTFIDARVNQAFPELALKEGDSLTDLVIKVNTLLWDPIVREIVTVKNNQSFRDPTILNLEEAESLGANLFSSRDAGDKSRGTVRVYFSKPQNQSINPANFCTSKSGLHFYPSRIQSIRTDEMLLNMDDNLYYFDIQVEAEDAGAQYNIGPDEIITIANLTSAVRITNKRRFKGGLNQETAEEYVGRVETELTERSLVTLRGIAAKITEAFPEVTRLAVIGFGDPEMDRDILKGGSLGPIVAGGVKAHVISDGEGLPRSRRIQIDPTEAVNFFSLIGPSTVSPKGFVLTLYDAYGAANPPVVRDLVVKTIVASDMLDLEEQVLDLNYSQLSPDKFWCLRREEITLSDIPGGILFPETAEGTVSINHNEVHIGGMTDIYVRGSALDELSLVINNLSDDNPLLEGVNLNVFDAFGHVQLLDLTLGVDYAVGDSTYQALQDAKREGYTLQLLEGVDAGSYRILFVDLSFPNPLLTIDPPPTNLVGGIRWKILDVLNIEMLEPKETRVSGSDMYSIQAQDFVETSSGTDFAAAGVSEDDILRIKSGSDAGDFTVVSLPNPSRVQVDRTFEFSGSNLEYQIFRPNDEGGITLPLVRVSSIDLLDSSSQPVGTTIPYAKPIDAQSTAFANFGRGVKISVRDAELGIISPYHAVPLALNSLGLQIQTYADTSPVVYTVAFVGGPFTAQQVVDEINTQAGITIAILVDGDILGNGRVGIMPLGYTRILGLAINDGKSVIFGNDEVRTTRDIRSYDVSSGDGWGASVPQSVGLERFVAQVLDGTQIGYYTGLDPLGTAPFPNFTDPPDALIVDHNFAPEARRYVEVGTRSIGEARVYFLEPTSIEFGSDCVFSTINEDGIVLNYVPDLTLSAQKLPGLPSGTKPVDGANTIPTSFQSVSVDFVSKKILEGDELVVDYIPIIGSIGLADPVVGLALTPLTLSIDGSADKVITFITDSPSIPNTDVTRDGVADQINSALGKTVCSINSSDELEFEYDGSIIIRADNNAVDGANVLLGFSYNQDTNNDAQNAGSYTISTVAQHALTLSDPLPAVESRMGFKVFRPGTQRISSTEMAQNTASGDLYYFDVELVSEGTGDLWNIDAGLQFTVTGYTSDGYYLTTDNQELSFSISEIPRLVISRSILTVGVDDDPENSTLISGQNIQINYERSTLVDDLSSFVLAEQERVVNENPLVRHLIPHFVRFDMDYFGGSKEEIVIGDTEDYINALYPYDLLESSDLQKIASDRGAISITNPIDLIAVVHNEDRTITAQRSQNALSTGRLAAFVPDVLNIRRRVS